MDYNDTIEIFVPDLSHIQHIVAILVPIFFGLIAITGFFGNSLVILVVISNPQMRSTTNLLIVNLAIADLLFVVFCIPFTAADYISMIWPFGIIWCKIVQYLIVVTAFASIYTLVLMSVDRFLAVVHPISSRVIRTENVTKIAIGLLWSIIIIVTLPVAYSHGLNEHQYGNNTWSMCQFLENDLIPQTTYHIIFFISTYLLPLMIISGLYICMITRLWKVGAGGRISAESHRGRKRVTRLVVVVVIAFASLWFPIQVILILKSLGMYEVISTSTLMLQVIAQILAYTSSCINPLLYAFLSDNFRKAFHKAVHCTSKYRSYSANLPPQRRISHGGRTSTTVI